MLLAILLIFFYLAYEVLPMFGNASISEESAYEWRGGVGVPLYLAMEEQGEVGFAVDASGSGHFFDTDSGVLRESMNLGGASGDVTVVAPQSAESRLIALGHDSGEVTLVKPQYRMSYPDGKRLITPSLEAPYAQERIVMGEFPISVLAVRDSEDALLIAAELGSGQLLVHRYSKEVDFLSEETVLELEVLNLPPTSGETAALHIGTGQRWLYRLGDHGQYEVIDLHQPGNGNVMQVVQQGNLFEHGGDLSSSQMLLGGISLLTASDRGEVVQFFMSRSERGMRFEQVRSFDTRGTSISALLPEHRRKGFLGLGDDGELQIFHSTAHRTLLREDIGTGSVPTLAAISPRGHKLLLVDASGNAKTWAIDNQHPEISWAVLWQKIWYENYEEPAYVWQSSAADNDFGPKYSFSPLAFGTLKAAFYSLLIAAPLGICGAIYTAYFIIKKLKISAIGNAKKLPKDRML